MLRLVKWIHRGIRGRRPTLLASRPTLEALEDRRLLSVTYHGGPLLARPEVQAIYLGNQWASTPDLVAQTNAAISTFANSAYMDMLGQYSVGRGQFLGSIIDPLPLGASIDDTVIWREIDNLLQQGRLQFPGSNNDFYVFTPFNIVVTSGGESSRHDFLGYHDFFTDPVLGAVHYIIAPFPGGLNLSTPGFTAFQDTTATISHELAETATDPEFTGWYDDTLGTNGGEVADLSNGTDGDFLGYTAEYVWSNQANQAILPTPRTLSQVASTLSHSIEYYTDLVTQVYQQYLKRGPDQAGLDGWVNFLANGLSDEQLEADFIGSPEYIASHGGTGRAWVTGMYQDLLGRTPSSAEVDAWVNLLNGGMAPTQVAYGFAASREREGQRIRADYSAYLGRSPSQAEVDAWVALFVQGYSNENVIAGFVASEEYFHARNSDVDAWLQSAYPSILNRPIDPSGMAFYHAILEDGLQ
jgi:hypothetical protein